MWGKDMRETTNLFKGNCVKEIVEGESRIRICDDYCRKKSQEDVKEILNNIAKKVQPCLSAKLQREYEEQQAK